MSVRKPVRRRIGGALAIAAPCLALLAPAAKAATTDDLKSRLLQCRQIVAPLARVGCYDAILAARPGAEGGSSQTRPPATPMPAAKAASSEASGPALRTSPQELSRADAAAFGLPQRESAAPSSALLSAIAGDFDGWTAQTRVRLANGQLWQIADGSEGAYRLRDPKVQIVRSAFGSFFMQIEGVPQTPKVRRIE